MDNSYILIITTYADYTTYGIAYVEYDNRRPYLIETYPDISPDPEKVQKLVDECNRKMISHRELLDAIEEFLAG